MKNELQLIKTNTEAATPVSFVRNCHKFDKIREYQDTEKLNQLFSLFILELEQHFSPKNQIDAFMVNDIKKLLQHTAKNLSVEEIFFASKLARYGDLGDINSFGTVNTKFVGDLIKLYKEFKRKTKVVNNITVKAEVVNPISEKKALELLKNGLETLKKEYKENPSLETLAGRSYYYDYLVNDLKVFSPSDEDKKEAYRQAKKIYAAEQKNDMQKKGAPFNRIKSTVENIKRGIEKTPVSIAKKILLNNYLKTL